MFRPRMHLVPIKQRVDKQHIERLLEADERSMSTVSESGPETVQSVLSDLANEVSSQDLAKQER